MHLANLFYFPISFFSMETSSSRTERMQTLNGEPLRVFVPTGSMRNRMLEYLFERGFKPEDAGLPEVWRSQGREDKYKEADLGTWRNNDSAINVLVRERNFIPRITATRTLMRGEPAIGLTNSDIVLSNRLTDPPDFERRGSDSLATYDLPIDSGRNGGTSRWALVAPKEMMQERTVYPDRSELNMITESPTLAQFFVSRRIGSITADIAERIGGRIEAIDGSEEERLQKLVRDGKSTLLLGIVESGNSAKERGLDWREVYRVQAQAVIAQDLLKERPDLVAAMEGMLGLRNSDAFEAL